MQTWTLWHPFEGVSISNLSWLGALLAAAAVLLTIRLEALGRRLRTVAAPLGLVSLEMALSSTESRHVIGSWSKDVRRDARSWLICDYWTVPVYFTWLAILGLIAAHWFEAKQLYALSNLATALAWAQWIFGLVDFATDSALLRMLQIYPEIPERLSSVGGWSGSLQGLLVLRHVFQHRNCGRLAAAVACKWLQVPLPGWPPVILNGAYSPVILNGAERSEGSASRPDIPPTVFEETSVKGITFASRIRRS